MSDDRQRDGNGELTERLRRLARYGAGWDGYRAEPASPAAVELACTVVAALGLGDGIEATLEPDGTVDVAGEFPRGRVLLAFSGDGAVSASVREDGTWRDAGSYRVSGAAVPAGLRDLLEAIPEPA